MSFSTATTLRAIADRCPARLQPAARANATASTLHQLADLSADLPPISPGDLASALVAVGEPRPDDAPPVVARRATCRELAMLAAEIQSERKDEGSLAPRLRVAAIWRALADQLRGDDPRQAAIATTLRREAAELAGSRAS